MEVKIKQRDWLFLIVCLGLGVLAEMSFFHGRIGLSYAVFITGFYFVLFLRYRLSFNHRRIGLLFMITIWILAGSYVFYVNAFFYHLNLFLIPALVFFHIVLITSPNKLDWATVAFKNVLVAKLRGGIQYSTSFYKTGFKKVFQNMDEQIVQSVRRIGVGLAIGVPLLLLITGLLMSADAVFQDVVLRLPEFILQQDFLEGAFRFVVVFFLTFLIFGIFQVLHVRPRYSEGDIGKQKGEFHWNSVPAVTILVMLNFIYVLFVVIQFKYLFGDGLQAGLTYAEYARRGFFELLLVTLINWTILMVLLKFVKEKGRRMNAVIKMMYSLLIVLSGVMLASSYLRLSMYEAAYGFTLDRILAHTFMIFLMVVFAYTLIRVWIERLSVFHFYIIAGLLFYTGLNAINIEQIIVDKNLERFEQTGKIDIYYLNSLSYTGWNGLVQLYERDEEYPGLQDVLRERQREMEKEREDTWQSFNFTKQSVTKVLKNLDI